MNDDEVDFLYDMLEEEDFEDFLERFDLTPDEVFESLISSGLIDIGLLHSLMRKV